MCSKGNHTKESLPFASPLFAWTPDSTVMITVTSCPHTQVNAFLRATHGMFLPVLPELARNLFSTQVSFARVLMKCGQLGRDTVTIGKTNSKCS